MNAPRRSSAVALLAAVVAAGCAATTAAPVSRPTAVRMLDPARVPPPPAAASASLTMAWDAVRAAAPGGALAGLTPEEVASPVGRTIAGFAALQQGDLPAARDAFGLALGTAPDLAEAAYGIGLVAVLQQRPDLARGWFETALGSDPGLTRAVLELRQLSLGDVGPLLMRAELAATGGDSEAAVAAYEEAMAAAPELQGPYLRIAALRQQQGDVEAAIRVLSDARRRTGDGPLILERLGIFYRSAERYADSNDVFQRLADARPDDPRVADLAREARDLYERDSLPPEYRELEAKSVITREELAALLAINLEMLEDAAGERRNVIVADVGARWSTPFVQRMVSWGVLDVYQNNDFFPQMQVRQSMLVEACYRVLELVGAAADAPRPRLDDPPPEHLLYRPVQAVVGLRILLPDGDGTFDLLALVSGAEAMSAVERLTAVVRRNSD
ncbi:MAG TPA: tetratricopeptide repeat protein [Acidobacteriota bacterium]|nr:tetratricopeptide repeat protein [Acidobacteriota bacterium]